MKSSSHSPENVAARPVSPLCSLPSASASLKAANSAVYHLEIDCRHQVANGNLPEARRLAQTVPHLSSSDSSLVSLDWAAEEGTEQASGHTSISHPFSLQCLHQLYPGHM